VGEVLVQVLQDLGEEMAQTQYLELLQQVWAVAVVAQMLVLYLWRKERVAVVVAVDQVKIMRLRLPEQEPLDKAIQVEQGHLQQAMTVKALAVVAVLQPLVEMG